MDRDRDRPPPTMTALEAAEAVAWLIAWPVIPGIHATYHAQPLRCGHYRVYATLSTGDGHPVAVQFGNVPGAGADEWLEATCRALLENARSAGERGRRLAEEPSPN